MQFLNYPITVIFFLLYNVVYSQDLNRFDKEQSLSFKGSSTLSYLTQWNKSEWTHFPMMSMSGTISWKGYDLPLSYTVTSGNKNFSHPFSQFRIAPKYKGFQFQFGAQVASLTRNTAMGRMFSGISTTWNHKSGTLKLIIGKPIPFERAQQTPLSESRVVGMMYSRKVKHNQFFVSGVWGKDSIYNISDHKGKSWQENLSVEVGSNFKVFKKSDLKFSRATSFTKINLEEYNSILSSTEIGVSIPIHSIRFLVDYERVDPGYSTLMTAFLQGDIEKSLIGSDFTLFEKKVKIRIQAGKQLSGFRSEHMDRQDNLQLQGDLSYSVNNHHKIRINYSGFQSLNTRFISSNELTEEGVLGYDTIVLQMVNRNVDFSYHAEKPSFATNGNITVRFNHQDSGTGIHSSVIRSFTLLWQSKEKITPIFSSITGNLSRRIDKTTQSTNIQCTIAGQKRLSEKNTIGYQQLTLIVIGPQGGWANNLNTTLDYSLGEKTTIQISAACIYQELNFQKRLSGNASMRFTHKI